MSIDYPFLQPGWLRSLEQCGAVAPATGWTPMHLDAPTPWLPLYLKHHSRGEYVFDQGWAHAMERSGRTYYPKLVSAIPFTPVDGPRWRGELDEAGVQALFEQVRDRARQEQASGWHLLFPGQAHTGLLRELPLIERQACHFRWYNRGYQSFDDFLEALVSRKRKMVRKERKKIVQQSIHVECYVGQEITPQHMQDFYPFYASSYYRRLQNPYLPPDFFTGLVEGENPALHQQMMLLWAQQEGQDVAAALYFFDHENLYGRYWGATRELDCLHFELCYYRGIEFAIDRGLQRFDPGVQGEHKILRGFEPEITHSFHWLANQSLSEAVRTFCREERQAVEAYQQEARQYLPYRAEYIQAAW